MTEKELMAILNDHCKDVVCFLSDRPHEVSREEFKAWLKGKRKPKRKASAKKKGGAK